MVPMALYDGCWAIRLLAAFWRQLPAIHRRFRRRVLHQPERLGRGVLQRGATGRERGAKARRFPEARKKLFLLGDGSLESGAGGELGAGGSRNLDGGAGLGILTGAGGTLHRLEGTETDQGDAIALGNGLGDGFDGGIQGAAGSGLADISTGGNGVDQIAFVH